MKILLVCCVTIAFIYMITYVPTVSFIPGEHTYTTIPQCTKCHTDKHASMSCIDCHKKNNSHAVSTSVQCKNCHNTLHVHHRGSHSSYTCIDCHVFIHGNIQVVRDCNICHSGNPYYGINMTKPNHHI